MVRIYDIPDNTFESSEEDEEEEDDEEDEKGESTQTVIPCICRDLDEICISK